MLFRNISAWKIEEERMKQIVENLEMESLTLEEARDSLGDYEFAIVHMISEMQYGTMDKIAVNWEELLELRAFKEDEELHIFDRNGEKKRSESGKQET